MRTTCTCGAWIEGSNIDGEEWHQTHLAEKKRENGHHLNPDHLPFDSFSEEWRLQLQHLSSIAEERT